MDRVKLTFRGNNRLDSLYIPYSVKVCILIDHGSRKRESPLLSLLTYVGLFSKTWFDTFRSVLVYGKEQES